MDIKVERLKVQFGDREILKNISLDFPKQKFTGIIGPNGSGKSTMLKCIYRVLERQRCYLSKRQAVKSVYCQAKRSDAVCFGTT